MKCTYKYNKRCVALSTLRPATTLINDSLVVRFGDVLFFG